jgi:rubrerythrin
MDGKTGDLMLLRDILAREISTINNYQSLLSQASTSEVATFISHILEEEKEHVAEALELIKELDPNQAAMLARGSHWKSEAADAHIQPSQAGSPAPRAEAPQAWTVGSLKGEKKL